jgi:hypothetical protein
MHTPSSLPWCRGSESGPSHTERGGARWELWREVGAVCVCVPQLAVCEAEKEEAKAKL